MSEEKRHERNQHDQEPKKGVMEKWQENQT
jgi:hypothetical protein